MGEGKSRKREENIEDSREGVDETGGRSAFVSTGRVEGRETVRARGGKEGVARFHVCSPGSRGGLGG